MKVFCIRLIVVLLIFSGLNFAVVESKSEALLINDVEEIVAELPTNVHPDLIDMVLEKPDKVVSVIVAKQVDATGVEEVAKSLGATITSEWEFINAFAAKIRVADIISLAGVSGVKGINLNLPVNLQHHTASTVVDTTKIVNAYNEAVKVNNVWAKGYYGQNVGIAVLDSGVNFESTLGDDLDRVVVNTKFSSSAINASDKYGHGTHVAGIIAGDGDYSSSKYVGIAPKANIINVKFSGDDGTAYEEDFVNSLEWVYKNKSTYNIRVVNISAAIAAKQSYKESPVSAAVEQLWLNGTVVVVAAGNRGGEECSTCYAPAHDPFVISVGAVDDNKTKSLTDDFVKSWSSSGATLDGHSKPEVMAPGGNIISYMPSGQLRSLDSSRIVDSKYFRLSGTSMAAPVVAGVVGLMLQVNPQWTPDEVKWILMNHLRPAVNNIGPGIVQADQSVFFTGTPGKANQGLERSPFLDSSKNTISYTNASWSNASWSNASWSNSLNQE